MTRVAWGVALLCALFPVQVQAQAQGPATPPPWRLALAAEGAFDGNPRFVADDSPDARGAASARLTARLERNWTRARTRLALRGDGSRLAYRRAPDLTRTTWGFEAQALYAFSPRLQGRLDGGRRNDSSRDLRALTDSGFVLRQVLSRSRRAAGELAWRAREHATLHVTGRYERFEFDSAELFGGATLEGGARLEYSPWRHASLSASAEWQSQRRAREEGATRASDGSTRSLFAGGSLGAPERVQATLALGATRLVPLGDARARTLTLLASGTLRARRGRHTFSVQFDRRASQAFGLGRSALTFGAVASDAYALTPRLELAARANWSRTRDPASPDFRLRAWGGSAELGLRATPALRARASYTLYRGEDAGAAPRTNHVVALSLSREIAW